MNRKKFYEKAYNKKLLTRKYIMPLEYRKTTHPTVTDIKYEIYLTSFKPDT